MSIHPELMPKHELEGMREHYDAQPRATQALLRQIQWMQEHIEALQQHTPVRKDEVYFQRREKQRAEAERGFP